MVYSMTVPVQMITILSEDVNQPIRVVLALGKTKIESEIKKAEMLLKYNIM